MPSPEPRDAALLEALERARLEDPLGMAAALDELRAVRPPVPASLQAQVSATVERAAEAPERARRRFRLAVPRPRLVALVAALCLAAVVGVLVARPSSPGGPAAGKRVSTVEDAGNGAVENVGGTRAAPALPAGQPPRAVETAVPSLTDRSRLQAQTAWLELRVPDATHLSRAVQRALHLVRGLGGYVESVDVDTRGRTGAASLDLRIPVRRLRAAVVDLSALGTIRGQHVQVTDLQARANEIDRRVRELRHAVVELRAKLARRLLSEPDRIRLQGRLDDALANLAAARQRARAVQQQAAYARLSVSLATPPLVGPRTERVAESRFHRAASEAAGALVTLGVGAVYLAVVGAPLAGLAALVWLGVRAVRRRGERRLLERA